MAVTGDAGAEPKAARLKTGPLFIWLEDGGMHRAKGGAPIFSECCGSSKCREDPK